MPRSRRTVFTRLTTSSPATESNAVASASCVTAIDVRKRAAVLEPEARTPSAFTPAVSAARTACVAGNRPNAVLVNSPSASVNASSRVSRTGWRTGPSEGRMGEHAADRQVTDGERAGPAEYSEQRRLGQQQPNDLVSAGTE